MGLGQITATHSHTRAQLELSPTPLADALANAFAHTLAYIFADGVADTHANTLAYIFANGVPDTLTNTLNDCGSLMTKDCRESTFWILTSKSVNICVTESVCDNSHSHFVSLRRSNKNFDHLHWFVGLEGDSCLAFYGSHCIYRKYP